MGTHGAAYATLICECGECTTVPLVNDGQYTNFRVPRKWRHRLGFWFWEDDASVLCPKCADRAYGG